MHTEQHINYQTNSNTYTQIAYLVCNSIHYAFSIRVDVDQHQSIHQIRMIQLHRVQINPNFIGL